MSRGNIIVQHIPLSTTVLCMLLYDAMIVLFIPWIQLTRLRRFPTLALSSSAKRKALTSHSTVTLHVISNVLYLLSTAKCYECLTSQITLDGGPRKTNRNYWSEFLGRIRAMSRLPILISLPSPLTCIYASVLNYPYFLVCCQAAYCPWQLLDDYWQGSGSQWTSSTRQVQISD